MTVGVVALNLGGPGSLDDVEPFLRNLFSDPLVVDLGWARPLQPLFARMVASRRAPSSREVYRQIGGRSPIAEESAAQAAAVARALEERGLSARPYTAMAAWRPNAEQAVAAMRADGIQRAIALPLYPHESRATTGSSFHQLARAADGTLEVAWIRRYPDAPGYVEAVVDRLRDAMATVPEGTTVLFSAHGLPESYIRGGDPYLDDIRTTVGAVARRLGLGARAQLAFQSRVGRQKWLGPYTEEALDRLADEGATAVVVCPIAFTGEHVETLQEIDILYRERAQKRGIRNFARARTVGLHPAFIGALADLALAAARERGWT